MAFEINKEFIVYDKQTIKCDVSKVSFYTNLYANFGWELDKNVSTGIDGKEYGDFHRNVTVNYKRDSMIDKKMELMRIQRIVEDCLDNIKDYEKKKKEKANYAFIGFEGAGLMLIILGLVFSSANIGVGSLVTILCVLGVICIIIPVLIYKKIVAEQTKVMIPKIDRMYEQIDELCEKANALLKK